MLSGPLPVGAQRLAVERMRAGAEIAQKIAHGLVQCRIVGHLVGEAFELADDKPGNSRVEQDLGGYRGRSMFAQGKDLRRAAAAGVVVGADAVVVRVAFLDKLFGRGEGHDLYCAARRRPRRAERRPSGPLGLVFVAQGGDGRRAAVPDMGSLAKGTRAAFADQSAPNTCEEILRREDLCGVGRSACRMDSKDVMRGGRRHAA